jgi:hypothetical protein
MWAVAALCCSIAARSYPIIYSTTKQLAVSMSLCIFDPEIMQRFIAALLLF